MRGDRMTTEERLNAIERNQQIISDNLNGLINMVSKLRINTDADINGARQSVANITPTVMTQKGYIQDKAVRFVDVPDGQITVSCIVPYSIYKPDYCNWLEIRFDKPLTEIIDVTISIL